ncbi:MAG: hypothetical protein JOZ39_02390 [Chloroflexi bacterium]|nr:hypothetical protein [Chloroflexota bacterium]
MQLGAVLPVLGFGVLCLVAYFGLRGQAEAARGERRFYVIGFYRSVLLAFGVLACMVAVSRLLTALTG